MKQTALFLLRLMVVAVFACDNHPASQKNLEVQKRNVLYKFRLGV